jgi:hypothetical protein
MSADSSPSDCVRLFASPDGYAGSSVQAAIASSFGTFSSVWQSVDDSAYGDTFNEIVALGGIGSEKISPVERMIILIEIMWKYQLIAWCVLLFFQYFIPDLVI